MKNLTLLLILQLFFFAAAGQHSLKGTVTSNDGALPGASVLIKNTFYGTSTLKNGDFEFKNLKPGNYTVTTSFIGYEPKEITVSIPTSTNLIIKLNTANVLTDEIMVKATRAGNKTPFSHNNISADELSSNNLGRDIPYLLQLTPSFVATSDAGAGVGYTNFRIRGTDLNRINVTVNGIPLNDAESHGTWFVDQPDLASSLNNIQIQRGVGTSTNGAAAFGATINLQTNTLKKDAYSEYKTAYGSFNTFKNTISAGTGLLNNKFTIDARLSKVSSDGFIDRAFSELKSFYVSGGYYSENSIIKINVFSGLEETYQAWNGVPSVRLNNDLKGMQLYGDHWLYSGKETSEMIASDNRTYNLYTYDNQIDHFQQDHYQIFFSHKLSPATNINFAGHYTHGSGYYENYKENEDLADYRLTYPVFGKDTIFTTNMVNRKWLDNDFYGATFALNHSKGKNNFTLGAGWNKYDGDHFGKIVWAQYLGETDSTHDWYRGKGIKKDFNIYAKYNLAVSDRLNIYSDIQYRYIDYSITGIDDDLRDIAQKHYFNFLNPKLGLYYQITTNQDIFLSYALAHREPNRDNYVDADPSKQKPTYEILNDYELGYSYKAQKLTARINIYYMKYKDQLVLTGQINDVGAPVLINTPDSYRAGIELQSAIKISKSIQWNINTTISENKIKNFTEYVDDWDAGKNKQKTAYLGITDLAFSPKLTGNSNLTYSPAKKINLSLISSYVGKQYIDNSMSNDRCLDSYFVNNLKADYTIENPLFDEIIFHAMLNNIFNTKYESNAWVYSYYYEGERHKMDGYFPQAGINFMVGVDFKF